MMQCESTAGVVHVVEDEEIMRDSLVCLLGAAGYQTRPYSSAGDYVMTLGHDAPGCILLDINMPGPSGLDLQRSMLASEAALPIVFMTGVGDVQMCARALKAGAIDFLTKPIHKDDLLAAIGTAIERDRCKRLARAHTDAVRVRYERLSPREREVASQIVQGRLNKQIAVDLSVSERTIKTYRAQLLEKMNVHCVAQLADALRSLEERNAFL